MSVMIGSTNLCGADGILLENDCLRVVLLPAHGGKVASIRHKAGDFELLFQNPKGHYRKASLSSAFQDYEACGFDDAFPSIDAGSVWLDNRAIAYPDHGEIWSTPFAHCTHEDTVTLRMTSAILPYTYEKSVRLDGNALVCSYRIANTGSFAFPYLWAFHCLVNYSPTMRILFPPETCQVENVLSGTPLGALGNCYSFPTDRMPDGTVRDFSAVPPRLPPSMEKYYVKGALETGCCGYRYPEQNMEATLSYDAQKLPYLGFWMTAGEFRGDCNCALEPSTGYYDSIACAQRNACCSTLAPGDSTTFSIEIRLQQLHDELDHYSNLIN